MDSELIFELVSSSPEETEKAGAEFAGMINGEKFPGFPCVIALCGDLGAGKTVFVRGMASVLCPGARVRSSTYTVVNEYRGELPLYHFDMYRINGRDDLYSIGFDDYLDKGICAIEWSEKIPFALPEKHFRVSLSEQTGERRLIRAERITGS